MTDDRPLVDQLNERLAEVSTEIRQLMSARQTERTTAAEERSALDDDEARQAHDAAQSEAEARYSASCDELERQYDDLKKERDRQQTQAEREADATAHAGTGTGITRQRDPLTYREDNTREHSFWRDLAAAASSAGQEMRSTTPEEARARISQHQKEMGILHEERRADRERRCRKQIDDALEQEVSTFKRRGIAARVRSEPMFERRANYSPPGFEARINPSTTQGYGGYFDPPEWLVQDFIPYLRAGRTTANLCRHMDIPAGYQSVNIPKVSTPTLVANQGANNVAVVSQDIADTAISTGFKTYAGQEDVAIQWLDMSPGRITETVVTEDLMAAYNLAIGSGVVTGTGTANSTNTTGQLAGLYPTTVWSGTAVTCTIASPTPASQFGTYGAQASQIAQARYDVSSLAYVVHPRRAYWQLFGLDGSSARPWMESQGFSPWNPGAIEEQEVAEGFAFTWPSGHKVYMDKNIPTTDNGSGVLTGTNDISLAANFDDVWLFEDAPRVRVFQEVLSGTLQVRFQIFSYVGLLVRYGGAIAIAQGTGFAAPTVNSGNF
jgi:hypothetical protein